MFEDAFKDDSCHLYIQWINELPFIHCKVFDWKLSTYKKLWQEYSNLVTTYGVIYSYIPKDSNIYKFNTMFGMTLVEETEYGYFMKSEV